MSRRQFSVRALRARLADFAGRCACGCEQEISAATGIDWDHVIPLELGGEDEIENMQPLTVRCHKAKTARDHGDIAKAKRRQAKHLGLKGRKQLIPGSRGTRFRKRLDGTVERRGS